MSLSRGKLLVELAIKENNKQVLHEDDFQNPGYSVEDTLATRCLPASSSLEICHEKPASETFLFEDANKSSDTLNDDIELPLGNFVVTQTGVLKNLELVLEEEETAASDEDQNFLPEEESTGSKSSFEQDENTLLAGENIPAKGRPKKGRKRRNILQLSREENKKRRNGNKTFVNYKGRVIKERKFENFCCLCTANCHTKITEDLRKQQFEKYWELNSYDAQTTFIGALVKENTKKRKYGRNCMRRQFSRTYCLGSTIVCRTMFIKTLGISTNRVNSALKKIRSSSITDKRGKKQGGKNKINDVQASNVIAQINKIPRYKSHYRREQCADAEFLPPELTLTKMYEKYKDEYSTDAVSFSMYRRIFLTKFNLKFKRLKKDTCNVCDAYRAQIQNSNESEKAELVRKHDEHIENWQSARQKMKEDMKTASDHDEIECLTFDLEKTLPLPRLPTNILFYKRQLWIYNCGIHSATYKRGYCNVWIEGQAGRGAQEVGSCLFKHITANVPPQVTEIILWSDSCGGQNRNIKLTLMMKALLDSHSTLKKIYMRFLVPGHSFLPNDTDFSDIECALKHQQRLYLPSDYIEVMKLCRKRNKFVVTEMNTEDFLGTAELEKKICNRKFDEEKKKVSWMETREIMLDGSKPYSIFMRKKFQGEYSELNIKKKSVGRPIQNIQFYSSLIKLWPKGKSISEPKLQDIKSIMHLIPSDAKPFYRRLTSDNNVIDDVDGFGAEPDFDLE